MNESSKTASDEKKPSSESSSVPSSWQTLFSVIALP